MDSLIYLDSSVARWYDWFNTSRGDTDFYLNLVMSADSVLDIGCGTGVILREARAAGHTGRLCGIDPAPAMLDIARRRTDIEWTLGDAASITWRDAFDLVIMTGHAFQELDTDTAVHTALTRMGGALRPGGRVAFETRNPQARAWQRWTPEHARTVTRPDGTWARMEHQVQRWDGDCVEFTHTFTGSDWDHCQVSRSRLRFLDVRAVDHWVSASGMTVDQRYGDWDRSPLVEHSPEIITVARKRY
ncbi:class I SAM-dependent methyltransferase [Lipingzhangella sp. LS1_29]|uniref:Class I SAM-dependent methyltransferase n=1 Tax=Lipingzhangella rawalii TaxID=2055835 RepID=A0ABU2H1C5_9ACTN|nr:class I SAM-dependent methyltransferase [Lipingzhangella rawalii]MDS1269096.1 class I SAM-dependent methyltransferase [Lipingzhangella rawalii]